MEIKNLKLESVMPSPMNPRKTFDQEELQELADNIEKQGLLQPITVRLIKDTEKFRVKDGVAGFHPEYEIICGERRYRAMKLLSDRWKEMDIVAPKGATYDRFNTISAIVREMNDEDAFDAMITENLQRKDVDPIEEAFAFGQLIERGKTVDEVAARFGKSRRFVLDRVKLNSLIPELLLAIKEARKKHDKLEEKLNALGYNTDGKLIEKVVNMNEVIPTEPDLPELDDVETMRNNHPDAILSFEVNGNYECYDQDAKDVSEVTGLSVMSYKKWGNNEDIVIFPKSKLDTYLPMLVRAKHRVAICEQKKK